MSLSKHPEIQFQIAFSLQNWIENSFWTPDLLEKKYPTTHREEWNEASYLSTFQSNRKNHWNSTGIIFQKKISHIFTEFATIFFLLLDRFSVLPGKVRYILTSYPLWYIFVSVSLSIETKLLALFSQAQNFNLWPLFG